MVHFVLVVFLVLLKFHWLPRFVVAVWSNNLRCNYTTLLDFSVFFMYTFRSCIIQDPSQWFDRLWKARMPTKNIHGVRNVICTCSLGRGICFLPFEWILNLESGLNSLQYLAVIVLRSLKMHNFELQFWHVGGCAG